MNVNRIIGRFKGKYPGPLFIAVAAIHGNEHAGLHALNIVFEKLRRLSCDFHGEFIGIAGNLAATSIGERFIDLDLNRQWYPEKVKWINGRLRQQISLSEDREQKELMLLFYRIKSQYPDRKIILIDFHTTSAEGGTFSICNRQKFSQEIALNLGPPVIIGLEKVIKGTTLHFFSDLGLSAFAFEAGQHYEMDSIIRMEAALWTTMVKIGQLEKEDVVKLTHWKNILAGLSQGRPKMVEFLYRHTIKAGDNFTMLPGFGNFQEIKKGQHLANDKNGPIYSEHNALMLMPLYQKQGDDGFFIVKESALQGKGN